MSSRALRKLQKDDDILESLLNKVSQYPPKQKGHTSNHTNLFAAIGHEILEDEQEDATEPSNEQLVQSEPKPSTSKRKNKKKVKKRKADNVIASREDIDDNEFEAALRQFRNNDVNTNDPYTILGESDDSGKDDNDHYETASDHESADFNFRAYNHVDYITGDAINDPGFSAFPVEALKQCTAFFNLDFKKLDPDVEYKTLFDDVSQASLRDIEATTSAAVSPQYLKQVDKLKRLVRNWGGKDMRTVPVGPGMHAQRLRFTQIRNDWLPTPRGELNMKKLNRSELMEWQLWQRPSDWRDVVQERVNELDEAITFYKFEPLDVDISKKSMTDFYLSVLVHPDHEAIINLISSKYPYHVPGLLQVALITIRQGDKTNTNGILQRALFVFDRAMKKNIKLDGLTCQLPYIYFFNRQFYLAIFRYIQALAQRGTIATAANWCKVLWSLSPLEDPLGVRYFIDHYLLLNEEYSYIINLSNSPLINTYKQWYTLGLSLGIVLSYLRRGNRVLAAKEIAKSYRHHPKSLARLYLEKLAGDQQIEKLIDLDGTAVENIEYASYSTRFDLVWNQSTDLDFLHEEIQKCIRAHSTRKESSLNEQIVPQINNPFFITSIPVNLIRFTILSEESSSMACIPSNIWSDFAVYEFDVLPPQPTTKESQEVLESLQTFVNEKYMSISQEALNEDENLLDQIRQLSMQEFISEMEQQNLVD